MFPISVSGVWGAATRKKAKIASVESEDDEEDQNPSADSDEDDATSEDADNDNGAGRVKLHDLLTRFFQWYRRPVYICFDADKRKNRNVRHAEIRTWLAFHSAGADVFQLCWPLEQGKGIDDFLARKAGTDVEKQRESFAELLKTAVPFLETLDHHDINAVVRELHRMPGDLAMRDELAGKIARKLKVRKGIIGSFQDQKDEPSGGEAIKIPPTAKPWDEEVGAGQVLDEICETIRRFVWMKPSQCRAAALWIVLSYLQDAVDILPILLITSPEEECGKTTLLKLIFYLSNRPVPSGNISAAAIYRTIKDICPTMTLDEAETYLKENEEMRGVIDSGHEREFAWVIRTAMEGEDTVQFSTWCPKALAMIGLPKKTILSRSIHIRLDRKTKSAKTEKLKKKHYQEFEDLRRKISRLSDDIRDRVKVFESELLSNRAGDNWQPLFAIADAAGEQWLKETEKAAQRMSRKDAKESKSFGHYLLESIARIIQEIRKKSKLGPAERIFLRSLDLTNKLNEDQEAPWKEHAVASPANLPLVAWGASCVPMGSSPGNR